jgi:uncharacterized membrane protein
MGFDCPGFGWGQHMWGGMGMWGGAGILGPILGGLLWLGLLAALAVGAFWLVRQLGRQRGTVWAGETPLDAARRRLATGEISVEEFDRIVQRTHGGPSAR